MAVFSHSFSIFFPPNRMKTSEFWPKKLGWQILPRLICGAQKSFDLVYYSPSNDFGNKSCGRLHPQFSDFFPPKQMKQVNFGRKNSVGRFRHTSFVELEKSFDLVYYRPSNDFWIKSYGRIQSQFF